MTALSSQNQDIGDFSYNVILVKMPIETRKKKN